MKNDLVCPPYTFKTTGKSYSSLMNRYKLGKVRDGRLFLDRYECSFLLITGKIAPEGGKPPLEIIRTFEDDSDFPCIFTAYYALKKSGFYCRVEGDRIEIRKKVSDVPARIIVRKERQHFSLPVLENGEEELNAIVDMDGDITIFRITQLDLAFSTQRTEPDAPVPKVEDRIVPDVETVPLWLGYARGNIRFLSEIEYRNRVSDKSELQPAQSDTIYADLQRRGLILKSGFKYGADFRGYADVDSEHAEYLIYIPGEIFSWSDLSRMVRVANAVRKKAILASAREEGINYLLVRRIKDFNELYSDQIWASKSSTVGLNSE